MAGETEYESFVFVFIFGVIFFIVGAIVLGGDLSDSGPSDSGDWFSSYGNGVSEDITVLARSGEIMLDSSAKIKSKFYSLGSFAIGEVVGESIMYSDDTVMIQNGISKKLSKEFSFERGQRKRVFLEFRILDMNDYGRLLIDFNDKRIYEEFGAVGKLYRIELNELADVNNIKISAESSGLRFWAPSTYVLKDFKVTTQDSDMKGKHTEFSLTSSQYKGFEKTVIRFQADSDDVPKDISIKLNGHEIYGDIPAQGKVEVISIEDKGILSVGKNTLDFESEHATFFSVKNADLECFFYDSAELDKKEILFSIDSKEYKN
ncbi:MAG: hypothetical protein KAR20_03340, partial [Candidatus Heimdallarchaeota archaeon]|nr:hypothetical protein [Candidatus Heimdallarchaeota archaeon]